MVSSITLLKYLRVSVDIHDQLQIYEDKALQQLNLWRPYASILILNAEIRIQVVNKQLYYYTWNQIFPASVVGEKLKAKEYGYGWDNDRTAYTCADDSVVSIRSQLKIVQRKKPDNWFAELEIAKSDQYTSFKRTLKNGINCALDCDEKRDQNNNQSVKKCDVIISGMQTNRSIEKIIRGAASARVVIFPNSVKRTQPNVFQKIDSIKQVIINEGVEKLDKTLETVFGLDGLFVETSLQRIHLPSTLKILGDNMFAKLNTLRYVELSEGLEKIGDHCFNDCNIQRLRIPASVKEIGEDIIDNNYNLKYVLFADNSQLEKMKRNRFQYNEDLVIFTRSGMKFKIEDVIDKTPILQISPFETKFQDYNLRQLRALRIVHLPDILKAVGQGWFIESGIEEVVVPASVRTLQKYAFAYCDKLKYIEFAKESQLEEIDERCFFNSRLECIKIPDHVRAIQAEAFRGCFALTHIIIQDNCNLERIGCGAFRKSGLEAFTAPRSLRVIEKYAFYSCQQLRNIQFQEGLEIIGNHSFSYTGLSEVIFPMTLKKNGSFVSEDEKNVFIHISDDTEMGYVNYYVKLCLRGNIKIGGVNLSVLRTLQTVEFPEGLKRIGSCWFQGSYIKKVIIPASVKEIGSHAFRSCRELKEIIFREKSCLETVGDFVFDECGSLRNVSLPRSVRSMGEMCCYIQGLETFTASKFTKEVET